MIRPLIAKSQTALIDPTHPVINALGHTFGGFLPGRRTAIQGIKPKTKQPSIATNKGQPARCDVVDEKLCDDILQYLAPTLEQHRGCTLIDINPGACVWSRKLHDFIQPNRHLLMEPDERYVEPFIQPLLNLPGSRYLHTEIPGLHPRALSENIQALLQKNLDFEPFTTHTDPNRRHLNPDILLTGNLSRRFVDTVRNNNSPQCDVNLQHMTWESLVNNLYHRNGPVRQLFWYPESNKRLVIPRRPNQKSSFNIGLLLGASITEVVGTTQTIAGARDERVPTKWAMDTHASFARESAKVVQERMSEAGMTIPEGREIVTPAVEGNKDEEYDLKSPLEIRHKTMSDLSAAYAETQDRLAQVIEACSASRKYTRGHRVKELFSDLKDSTEYPQVEYMVRDYPALSAYRVGPSGDAENMSVARQRMSQLMDFQLRIINLEAHVKHFEDLGEDVADMTSKVVALDKQFLQSVHSLSTSGVTASHLEALILDQLMFFSSPPQLAADRRAYEPLKARREDFWPKFDMCLFDITPDSRDMSVPGVTDRVQATKTAQELLKYLLARKGDTLPLALDKIAPNAAQDLIPMVPSFSDPRKGGRLNVDAVRVQMLNEEMVEGLVKAWYEWPFAPSYHELALAAGGAPDEREGVFAGLVGPTGRSEEME